MRATGSWLATLFATSAAVTACAGDRGQATNGGGDAAGDGGDATGNDDGGDGDGDDGDDGRFDVAPGEGGGQGDETEGCEKIDFLFLVDNSSSMLPHQQKLIAAFPRFIETIQSDVQGTDHHIMVVDSDDDPTFACEPSVHDGDPEWERVCPPGEPSCHAPCPSWPEFCTGYQCGANQTTLDADDKTLGCGIVGPYGGSASNRDCSIEGGQRYMTDAQTALSDTFACAALVGISGHWNELPVTSILDALDPVQNGAGGCNGGFLRDDAILVVVFVSDDDDQSSAAGADVVYGSNGSPQEWHDRIVELKNGHEENIVVFGVVSTENPANPMCEHGNGIYTSPKFVEFIESFGDHGLVGDVCDEDYNALFIEAVGLIDQACDEYVPEG
jgi:hypothetical protein